MFYICTTRSGERYFLDGVSKTGCKVFLGAKLGNQAGPFDVKAATIDEVRELTSQGIQAIAVEFEDPLESAKREAAEKKAKKK